MRKYAAPLLLAAVVLATGLSLQAADAPASSAKPKGYQAITKFSEERSLSFVRPARVVEVVPNTNDEVKADQIIARLDDTEERAALEVDIHKATISDPISKKAEEAVKEKDEKKYKNMRASGAAAQTELDEAELAVVVDQARIDNATDQIVQDELKVKQGEAAIAKLPLRAPSDLTGTWVVVPPANPNQMMLKVGEIADSNGAKIIRIARADPIWVDVSVPRAEAQRLKDGSTALITLSDPEKNPVLTGKVLMILPQGEAASGTLVVRVEVPNPANPKRREVGEAVFVTFPSVTGVAVNP